MSTETDTSTSERGLSAQQRDALLEELFGLHRELEPEAHLCFCGGDSELIEGVRELRARVERELGDDEPEL